MSASLTPAAGYWTTFSSIPIELNQAQIEFVDALKCRINEKLNFFGLENFVVNDDFHMSISRTFNVKKKVADQLSDLIENEFKLNKKFLLTIDKIEVFKSDENSNKYFLAFIFQNLKTSESIGEPLNNIVEKLNKCLSSFKLPAYYKNPIHHLSLCRFSIKNENCEQTQFSEEKIVAEANDFLIRSLDSSSRQIEATRIRLKCGNKVYFTNLTD